MPVAMAVVMVIVHGRCDGHYMAAVMVTTMVIAMVIVDGHCGWSLRWSLWMVIAMVIVMVVVMVIAMNVVTFAGGRRRTRMERFAAALHCSRGSRGAAVLLSRASESLIHRGFIMPISGYCSQTCFVSCSLSIFMLLRGLLPLLFEFSGRAFSHCEACGMHRSISGQIGGCIGGCIGG